MNLSFSGFLDFLLDKTLKSERVLGQILRSEWVKQHIQGWIHLHKLPYSLWIPYCVGWSLRRLLEKGLHTPTIRARPPKHFTSAISMIVDYLYITQQEWTGAQAFTAFDLYTAPFIAEDGLDRKQAKQVLQGMLYQLNVPARLGLQSPFTNITLLLDTNPSVLSEKAILAGKAAGTLGDYLDEAISLTEALLELYIEGDATGQPFTFPIPTLMLTRNFDWNGRRWGDLTDLIFEALAKKGTAYMLNGYVAGVDQLYAMCCRLTIDTSKMKLFLLESEDYMETLRKKSTRGLWAIPDGTGSIGIVTINLPRLAAVSKGEWSLFEELLLEKLELARSILNYLRKRYMRHLLSGLMPITKYYLGTLTYHFNTIGLLGLPEAAANLTRNPKLWEEGSAGEIEEAVETERRIVSTVRKISEEFEEEDGVLYNVEETPGESTSYRFALQDSRLFKGRTDVLIPGGNTPFYSNSIVPYYSDVPLHRRVILEGKVHREFTGGVILHIFLAEQPDPRALKGLVRKIAENTQVVYFSITPTITHCDNCNKTFTGHYAKCPSCGSTRLDHWSRIVGYYRPTKNWNPGKKQEFRLRVNYRIP